MKVTNFEETRGSFLLETKPKVFNLKQNQFGECWCKMLKVSLQMVSSLKIVAANTQFSVTLATSWWQFQTLMTEDCYYQRSFYILMSSLLVH